MDKDGRSLATYPMRCLVTPVGACGHLKNKHGDRHHMPEAAYEIQRILSIIGMATLILTA